MNKRQRKKILKKQLPVIFDEVYLIGASEEERKKALEGYEKFLKKYAYRKKYKDLKPRKILCYFPTPCKQMTESLKDLYRVIRKENNNDKAQS